MKEFAEKISIIVASYNYEKFIAETLDSLIKQTYQNFEVIVVDDGSRDNSVAVIEDFAAKDKRIKLFRHEGNVNKGLAETLKLGLREAQGDWIAFCESDDVWYRDHLEKKIGYIERFPKIDIVLNDIWQKFYNGNLLVKEKKLAVGAEFRKPLNVFLYTMHGCEFATFSCVMIRRKWLDGCNFDSPVKAWLDWWLWLQISLWAKVVSLDVPLTMWRMHGDSYCNETNDERESKLILMREKARDLLKNKYKWEYNFRVGCLYAERLKLAVIRKIFRIKHKPNHTIVKVLGVTIMKFKRNQGKGDKTPG